MNWILKNVLFLDPDKVQFDNIFSSLPGIDFSYLSLCGFNQNAKTTDAPSPNESSALLSNLNDYYCTAKINNVTSNLIVRIDTKSSTFILQSPEANKTKVINITLIKSLKVVNKHSVLVEFKAEDMKSRAMMELTFKDVRSARTLVSTLKKYKHIKLTNLISPVVVKNEKPMTEEYDSDNSGLCCSGSTVIGNSLLTSFNGKMIKCNWVVSNVIGKPTEESFTTPLYNEVTETFMVNVYYLGRYIKIIPDVETGGTEPLILGPVIPNSQVCIMIHQKIIETQYCFNVSCETNLLVLFIKFLKVKNQLQLLEHIRVNSKNRVFKTEVIVKNNYLAILTGYEPMPTITFSSNEYQANLKVSSLGKKGSEQQEKKMKLIISILAKTEGLYHTLIFDTYDYNTCSIAFCMMCLTQLSDEVRTNLVGIEKAYFDGKFLVIQEELSNIFSALDYAEYQSRTQLCSYIKS